MGKICNAASSHGLDLKWGLFKHGDTTLLAGLNRALHIFDDVLLQPKNRTQAYELCTEVLVVAISKNPKFSLKKINYFLDVQQISERIIVDIPVKVINKVRGIRVFPSPQTVSLTVVGGVSQIADIKPNDISVIVDFKSWKLEKSFYAPKIAVPFDILNWKDLSPRTIELGVARESK